MRAARHLEWMMAAQERGLLCLKVQRVKSKDPENLLPGSLLPLIEDGGAGIPFLYPPPPPPSSPSGHVL